MTNRKMGRKSTIHDLEIVTRNNGEAQNKVQELFNFAQDEITLLKHILDCGWEGGPNLYFASLLPQV